MLLKHGLAGLTHKAGGGVVFSDNFNRTNEALEASANWNERFVEGGTTWDIVSNAARCNPPTGTNLEGTQSIAAALANNCYAIGEYSGDSGTLASNTAFACVILRYGLSGSDNTGYSAEIRHLSDNSWEVRAGILTTGVWPGAYVAANWVIPGGPSVGDRVRLNCNGTTISVDYDDGGGWVERITGTDATHASGDGAIGGMGSAAGRWIGFDSVEFGNL